ncbi:hypothetical protein HPHPP25_0965 [Helicobacter pylori Hp P-25]|nr:hypothetical protein HPHPP25_0965 [Helicobacter pylori Hp P-25]EJC34289.1 hypothetical protein HPHPP25C_0853 [Helicobacter pylori Hp P-25c]EJC36568.1 hypothetical protein HPHPP25D_1041 [Helicobacter pylori Hp P-25d]
MALFMGNTKIRLNHPILHRRPTRTKPFKRVLKDFKPN